MAEPEITDVREITSESQMQEIAQKIAQKAAEKSAAKAVPPTNGVPATPTPATPTPEAKPEGTPEAKPEAKPEGTPETPPEAEKVSKIPKRKSVSELLSSPKFSKKEVKEVDDDFDYKEAYSKLSQKLEDPAVKAVITGRANGQDLFSILDKVRGPNIASMTDEQVYASKLQQLGAKSEEDPAFVDGDLSLESEMAKFSEMSAIQRRREVDAIRGEMKKDTDNRVREFYDEANQVNPEYKNAYEYANSLAQFGKGIVGQTVLGLEATQGMVDDIIQEMQETIIPLKEDGSYDKEKIFEWRFFDKHRQTIAENIQKVSYSNGLHENADEVEAIPGTPIHDRVPDIQPQFKPGSEEEAGAISTALRPI